MQCSINNLIENIYILIRDVQDQVLSAPLDRLLFHNLLGDCDLYCSSVIYFVFFQPDGSAYISSGLRVGHVIIGLNGYLMKGLLHREAALFIASAFKDKNTSRMDLLVAEPFIDEQ
jgi:hypothetical protein